MSTDTRPTLGRHTGRVSVDLSAECRSLYRPIVSTDTRSTDALSTGELKRLTPAPRTTHCPPLHGLPYGLLHGLPLRPTSTDYPKKSTKFLLRSTKIQKAYLLFLHDHNCTKNTAIFFSYISRPSLFHFAPFFTGRPATCQNAVSTMVDR